MAEIAISKRIKITEAQEYMLLAVLVASIFLGTAIALGMHFSKQISFNADVIMAKDEAIVNYSDIIKNVGICVKPHGDVYSEDELKKCNTDSIDIDRLPGTLRANILEGLAANKALNSVPRDSTSNCINPATGEDYKYQELNEIYNAAESEEELTSASNLIKTCSVLRIIPNALPAYKNEEAFSASMANLFVMSGQSSGDISTSDSYTEPGEMGGLGTMELAFSKKMYISSMIKLLDSIERSIRNLEVISVTIGSQNNDQTDDGGEGTDFNVQLKAYYTNRTMLEEVTKTIKAKENKK